MSDRGSSEVPLLAQGAAKKSGRLASCKAGSEPGSALVLKNCLWLRSLEVKRSRALCQDSPWGQASSGWWPGLEFGMYSQRCLVYRAPAFYQPQLFRKRIYARTGMGVV